MRVAIIGGGAAGLSSARHLKADRHECEIFEMTPQIGGTWVYTDDVGNDKYGFPVYSPMYQGLRTNLPKEVMQFPDYPIQEQEKSYLNQEEVLDYLNQYVQHFELEPMIKTNHMVIDIRPLENHIWQITTIYKPNNSKIVREFDSVIICNGHYNEPIIPNIQGQEYFNGRILHSHKYRCSKPFRGLRVLVVGAGASGLDMCLQISKVAKKVVLSHHVKEAENVNFLEQKPDIYRILDSTMVEFVDGSCCPFDCILFCTGFKYDYPFLNQTCGVTVTNNHIEPLYKHMIHIERPTMCFIGIPFNVCAFRMFDLQARFFCKYLNGSMSLPSRELMTKDTEKEMQARWKKGYTRRQAHMMGADQQKYYDDLAKMANIKSIPPVIIKLREFSNKSRYEDLNNFRENNYKIIDDDTYVKARFFCKYLNGSMSLPSRELMTKDTEKEMQARWKKGYTRRQAHMMGADQQKYYDDLAKMANIKSIPPVIIKLREFSNKSRYEDLNNFRENNYKIIDDDTYVKARFFCKYLNGSMSLPSRELMTKDTEKEMQARWKKGYTRRQAHMMGADQQKYYDDLAKMANIKSIPPVIIKLREFSNKSRYEDLNNFRENNYKIIDDDTYVKVN